MNRKGQIDGGSLIGVAVVIIVGMIMLVASVQNVSEVTDTVELENSSITVTNGTAFEFTGFKALSDVEIYNITGSFLLSSSNYTITDNVVSNGAEVVTITPTSASVAYLPVWNISGTAQPTTYDTSSGGRAIAGLIVVFFALLIAVIALNPTMRSKVLGG